MFHPSFNMRGGWIFFLSISLIFYGNSIGQSFTVRDAKFIDTDLLISGILFNFNSIVIVEEAKSKCV
jgi:hypothetical protein